MTAAANPYVVPTACSVAGALAAETLQPTLSSERRCCACFLGIDGAHALGRSHALSSQSVQLQAETLGGVVLSGRRRLPRGNAGTIHQHPLL